jgi:polyhydroxyalkanoate synthase
MASSPDEGRESEALREEGTSAPVKGPAAGARKPRAPNQKFPAVATAETAARAHGADSQQYAEGAKAPTAPPATESWVADRYSYVSIDRAFKANLARLTFGLSPAVLAEQTFDWLVHLATLPGKQLQLTETWARNVARFALYAAQRLADPSTPPCIAPLAQDRRFRSEDWQKWPYNLIYQSFLLTEQWWQNATTNVDGMSQRNQDRLSFTVRQLLDMGAPSNFVWSNPDVARATIAQGGRNPGDAISGRRAAEPDKSKLSQP